MTSKILALIVVALFATAPLLSSAQQTRAITLSTANSGHVNPHGQVYTNPLPLCFEDDLANDGRGRITEIWAPGVIKLLGEELSDTGEMALPLQAYKAGWGPRCFAIYDFQWETPNGYNHAFCAPPGWSSNNAPPCPGKLEGRP